MTLIGIMVLSLCGSVAATADDSMNTTNLTNNRHVFINVSNDNGTRFDVDYATYISQPGAENGYLLHQMLMVEE